MKTINKKRGIEDANSSSSESDDTDDSADDLDVCDTDQSQGLTNTVSKEMEDAITEAAAHVEDARAQRELVQLYQQKQ